MLVVAWTTVSVVRSGHIVDVISRAGVGWLDMDCERANRKQKFEYIYRKLPVLF